MEILGNLYDVVFFLIVFVLVIALLVTIAELKRSLDKKKFQEIERRRKQVLQEKMKTCNAEATTKALKGDERKKFMSSCLSN